VHLAFGESRFVNNILAFDVGKPLKTHPQSGRWSSIGCATGGREMSDTIDFQRRLRGSFARGKRGPNEHTHSDQEVSALNLAHAPASRRNYSGLAPETLITSPTWRSRWMYART